MCVTFLKAGFPNTWGVSFINTEIIEAALNYSADEGLRPPLRIFPVGRDKKPLISRWPARATADGSVIRDWWTKWPDANIAMAAEGFVVIDVDEHDPAVSGSESLHALERRFGELPDTWEQITPSGGRHIFFRYAGSDISVGTGLAPGIDWRGSGGYVVIAPSVLPNGRYEWEAGHMPADTPLAELPRWLHDLITAKRPEKMESTELSAVIKKGERNDVLFRTACSLRSRGLTEAEMLAALKEMNRSRCDPLLDEGEVEDIVASAARYEPRELKKASGKYLPPDLSDAGNAEVFSRWAKDRLRWCNALGWLCWDGMRWAQSDHAATQLAMEFAQLLLDEAMAIYKDDVRIDHETGKIIISDSAKNALKHARKTRNAAQIQSFMNLSKAHLNIRADHLDARWWCLNTAAGIIDLRTGRIGPHDPEAYCTKLVPFAPSDEGMDLWLEMLDAVSCSDGAWIEYDQMLKGSMIFGKVHEEKVLIEVGGGRNGKSTESNAVMRVLGDYAGTIDSAVLTTDRQNRGASLATLRGKRFVICGELEEGQRLSISTLKKIASTDPMTIEEKYRQPETIIPSHHIVLYSNFLPRVGSTDEGTWRRITVLPFRAQMPEGGAEIKNYADELVEKAGGAILKWLIEGAVKYWKAGCRIEEPESVRQATEEYRAGENWVHGFVDERCIKDPDVRERVGKVYEEYQRYAQSVGEYCRRASDFAKAMKAEGYETVTVNGKKYWQGLALSYA